MTRREKILEVFHKHGGMTDKELMQMALDALAAMQTYAAAEKKGLRICDEAIEALRARLAQPNEFNPDWDAMAVIVEEQQRMAKRIAELEAQLEEKNAPDL